MPERQTHHYLTLLRHGESTGNAAGIWQGHLDTKLTDAGRAQAAALAARWQSEGKTFDALLASPLLRALETARIIGEVLDLKIETDPVFMERDNGEMAGTARSQETEGQLPLSIYEPLGKSGESEMSIFLRGAAALQTILQRAPGRYLVISHGGLLNRMISAALGLVPQAVQPGVRFAFGNTGFASLHFRPDQNRWVVTGINDQQHLAGGELPTWQG